MSMTLSDLLMNLSDHAASLNEPTLAHICRMGALEARDKPIPAPLTGMTIIGMWDWDAVNDINYLDEGCAALFGVDTVLARNGMSINEYMKAVHPDDVPRLTGEIIKTLKSGGPLEIRYRVITNGRVRHILARGMCTLDNKTGRAERFPGVILEFPHGVM